MLSPLSTQAGKLLYGFNRFHRLLLAASVPPVCGWAHTSRRVTRRPRTTARKPPDDGTQPAIFMTILSPERHPRPTVNDCVSQIRLASSTGLRTRFRHGTESAGDQTGNQRAIFVTAPRTRHPTRGCGSNKRRGRCQARPYSNRAVVFQRQMGRSSRSTLSNILSGLSGSPPAGRGDRG